MFVLCANLLGDRLGLLSVAVGWAVGYPIAFAALAYLVATTIELPLRSYLRRAWGIIGCCLGGFAAGLAVDLALPHASDLVRLVAIGGTAIVVIVALLSTGQQITPRSIGAALKG